MVWVFIAGNDYVKVGHINPLNFSDSELNKPRAPIRHTATVFSRRSISTAKVNLQGAHRELSS